jgi:hypothetical protein
MMFDCLLKTVSRYRFSFVLLSTLVTLSENREHMSNTKRSRVKVIKHQVYLEGKSSDSPISLLSLPKEIWANHIVSYLTIKNLRKGCRMTSKWFGKVVILHVLQYIESIHVYSIEDYSFIRPVFLDTADTDTSTSANGIIQTKTRTRTNRVLKHFTCHINSNPSVYNRAIINEIKVTSQILAETLKICDIHSATLEEFQIEIEKGQSFQIQILDSRPRFLKIFDGYTGKLLESLRNCTKLKVLRFPSFNCESAHYLNSHDEYDHEVIWTKLRKQLLHVYTQSQLKVIDISNELLGLFNLNDYDRFATLLQLPRLPDKTEDGRKFHRNIMKVHHDISSLVIHDVTKFYQAENMTEILLTKYQKTLTNLDIRYATVPYIFHLQHLFPNIQELKWRIEDIQDPFETTDTLHKSSFGNLQKCHLECTSTGIDGFIILQETLLLLSNCPKLVEFSLCFYLEQNRADYYESCDYESDEHESVKFVDYLMGFFTKVIIPMKRSTLPNDDCKTRQVKSCTSRSSALLLDSQLSLSSTTTTTTTSSLPLSSTLSEASVTDIYDIHVNHNNNNDCLLLESIVLDTRLWKHHPSIVVSIPVEIAYLLGPSLRRLELYGVYVPPRDVSGTIYLMKELQHLSLSTILFSKPFGESSRAPDCVRMILIHLPKLITLKLGFSQNLDTYYRPQSLPIIFDIDETETQDKPEPTASTPKATEITKITKIKENKETVNILRDSIDSGECPKMSSSAIIRHQFIESIISFIPVTEEFFKTIQVCYLEKFAYTTWNNRPVSNSLIEQFFFSHNRSQDSKICEFHPIVFNESEEIVGKTDF